MSVIITVVNNKQEYLATLNILFIQLQESSHFHISMSMSHYVKMYIYIARSRRALNVLMLLVLHEEMNLHILILYGI